MVYIVVMCLKGNASSSKNCHLTIGIFDKESEAQKLIDDNRRNFGKTSVTLGNFHKSFRGGHYDCRVDGLVGSVGHFCSSARMKKLHVDGNHVHQGSSGQMLTWNRSGGREGKGWYI